MRIATKDYWYYSNGTYELKTTKNSEGLTTQIKRNITGPIPLNQIYPIVKEIDPSSQTWEEDLRRVLELENFNTHNILAGVPEEVGITLKGRIKYLFDSKKWVRPLIVISGIIVLIAAPFLIARFLPQLSRSLEMPLLEKNVSLWNYGVKQWSSMICSRIRMIFVMIVIFRSEMIEYFRKNLEDVTFLLRCGAKVNKINIIMRNQEILIPEEYTNDPVLQDHICPISQAPIRIPCRTSAQQVFEMRELIKWVTSQVESSRMPRCPITRAPIDVEQLQRDVELSDTIELRLLLLRAKREAV